MMQSLERGFRGLLSKTATTPPPLKGFGMSEFISPDDTRYDERARALVRIGREAIAVENDEQLNSYSRTTSYSTDPTAT
jgi:hypothetical protein